MKPGGRACRPRQSVGILVDLVRSPRRCDRFPGRDGPWHALADAHLLSFGTAALVGYFLQVRRFAVAAGRGAELRLHVHLLVVGLFAVFARGAVLGLLTTSWGWPAQISIVPAVIATLAITSPGYAFALRTTKWTLGSGEQWRLFAMYLVAAAFLLRLIYIGQVELLPEDSYYWNYARHLDIGYLDHPPMVAWLIWLGTAVFGDRNSVYGSVRWVAQPSRRCSRIG